MGLGQALVATWSAMCGLIVAVAIILHLSGDARITIEVEWLPDGAFHQMVTTLGEWFRAPVLPRLAGDE